MVVVSFSLLFIGVLELFEGLFLVGVCINKLCDF